MFRLTRFISRFSSTQSKFTIEEVNQIQNWANKFPLSHIGAAQLLTGYSLEGEAKDFSKIFKEELGLVDLMKISTVTVWQSLLNWGKMDHIQSKLQRKYHKNFFQQIQFLILMTDNMVQKYGKEATNQKWKNIYQKYSGCQNKMIREYLTNIPAQYRFAVFTEIQRYQNKMVSDEGEDLFACDYVGGLFSDTLQFNVKRCALNEACQSIGKQEHLSTCVCQGDDITFNNLGKEFGFKFERSGTMSKGAKCCDFKFKKE